MTHTQQGLAAAHVQPLLGVPTVGGSLPGGDAGTRAPPTLWPCRVTAHLRYTDRRRSRPVGPWSGPVSVSTAHSHGHIQLEGRLETRPAVGPGKRDWRNHHRPLPRLGQCHPHSRDQGSETQTLQRLPRGVGRTAAEPGLRPRSATRAPGAQRHGASWRCDNQTATDRWTVLSETAASGGRRGVKATPPLSGVVP